MAVKDKYTAHEKKQAFSTMVEIKYTYNYYFLSTLVLKRLIQQGMTSISPSLNAPHILLLAS